MKKHLLGVIFLIFIIPVSLHAQNILKLDEKNGLKDFKLGDTYSQWKDSLSSPWKENNIGVFQVKSYSYMGNCCQTVFTREVEAISLSFQNDTLYNILFILKNVELNFDLIQDIVAIFGDPSKVETMEDDLSITAYWVTTKITLTVMFNDCLTIATKTQKTINPDEYVELVGRKKISILIIDRLMDQKLINTDY